MSRRAVVLAVLLGLAGCSTLGPATPTVTPAPVPGTPPAPLATPTVGSAATPTPPVMGATPPGAADSRLAPGVTRRGVVDPLALANAHARGLRGSYAFRSRWTVRDAETRGGHLRTRIVQAAQVEGRAFGATVAIAGERAPVLGNPPARASVWSDGRELVERVERPGSTTYFHFGPSEYPGGGRFFASLRRPIPWRDVYVLSAAIDLRVVGSVAGEAEDSTVYILRGSGLQRPDLFAAATGTRNPRDVVMTTQVSEQGVVLRQDLSYSATVGGDPVRITRRVSYSDVGSATVERPDWYGTAVDLSKGGRTSNRSSTITIPR